MSLSLVPTAANEAEFLALFNRLCVALRESQDESGITQQVYWESLSDVPLDALDAGATALMRQPGRRFFPTTAEWRTEAERSQTAHLREAVGVGRAEPWKHECLDCEDSGWIMGLTCDGSARGACGRPALHMAHTYTRPCPCRMTNRTYRRHLAFGGGSA